MTGGERLGGTWATEDKSYGGDEVGGAYLTGRVPCGGRQRGDTKTECRMRRSSRMFHSSSLSAYKDSSIVFVGARHPLFLGLRAERFIGMFAYTSAVRNEGRKKDGTCSRNSSMTGFKSIGFSRSIGLSLSSTSFLTGTRMYTVVTPGFIESQDHPPAENRCFADLRFCHPVCSLTNPS